MVASCRIAYVGRVRCTLTILPTRLFEYFIALLFAETRATVDLFDEHVYQFVPGYGLLEILTKRRTRRATHSMSDKCVPVFALDLCQRS
jgi:hypothetical protein